MTLTDPIGDMFTRIRNGQMRSMTTVEIPASNFRLKILDVLKAEGFIINYFIEKKENNKKILKVDLKYFEGNDVKRYSYNWSNSYLKYGSFLAEPRTINLFNRRDLLTRASLKSILLKLELIFV